MKKKISLMLAAALTAGLALTGCGGSKTSDIKKKGTAHKLHSPKKQSYYKHDRQGCMSAWLQSSYAHTWRLHHRYAQACG